MRKFKKMWAILLSGVMAAGMLSACASDTGSSQGEQTEAPAETPAAGEEAGESKTAGGSGKVYYLNFKPEQGQQWVDLAAAYTEETGVSVVVETAASGTYESTLKSEMAKTDAPTLFQVNGPIGLANWQDYCYDLKDSEIYKNLKSDEFALLGDAGQVYGIAYVIETYGIIYNKALLEDYCAMDGAVVKSSEEINNFATLKAVADDIQAKKDDLGVLGAFASTGMDSSSDWRFKTHLANLPLYYEYQADGIDSTDAVKGTYLDQYKQIFDLYITDSTCEPGLLSSKTGDDAAAEFATGEAVFYQNGTWAYNDITGYDVADEDIGMLPIYIGAEGEENQGLCTGSENYWCINNKASEEWKNGVGSALLEYAQGTGNWDAVVTAFVDGWAAEVAATK